MSNLIDRIKPATREAMLAHAEAEAPRECCGLLLELKGDLLYRAAANLAEGAAGQDRFTLDPAAWLLADELGAEVVAIVHSHPGASANPSMADRAQCERSGLPWVIVGWPSAHLVELQPEGWEAPLKGRTFHHGVMDCYTLVQDWYRREWGLVLPDFEREDGWWEPAQGKDLYRDGLEAAGFVPVHATEGELLPGDGLLMRVLASVPNHAAVYLGDGMMLHHPYGQLSRVERYDWNWQRRTAMVVRHRSKVAP
jgi:cell wall-associated NlpC family hydrolase